MFWSCTKHPSRVDTGGGVPSQERVGYGLRGARRGRDRAGVRVAALVGFWTRVESTESSEVLQRYED